MSQTEVQLIKNGAVVDADINGMSSSKLSGALPAISGAALTNLPAGAGKAKNLIINGNMEVAQRGTSFAAPADGYTLDRWSVYENLSTGQFAVTQEAVTDLVGHTKAVKINCTTAEAGVPSASGTQYATYIQQIEAQNLSHIGNGTSAAKTLSFSFYVKSNVTGTFCVSFYKPDNTTRLLSLPYTINSANTWEQKTLLLPADTTGGGINTDTGQGLGVYFILARKTGYSGTTSTSWINYTDSGWANTCTASIFENVNDHIFITGCQLEVGSTATDFEHRFFGEELLLCQRYYQVLVKGPNKYFVGTACNYNTNQLYLPLQFVVQMRAAPTLVFSTGTSYYQIYDSVNSGGVDITRPQDIRYVDERGGSIHIGASYVSGLTAGNASLFYAYNSGAFIAVEAEL